MKWISSPALSSNFDRRGQAYVATPTRVREEICVAAANHGKHVLGEKPFANLASLQRITAACRQMIGNPVLLEASISASERTQKWLDAIWNSALANV